jgi:hypothetical protein
MLSYWLEPDIGCQTLQKAISALVFIFFLSFPPLFLSAWLIPAFDFYHNRLWISLQPSDGTGKACHWPFLPRDHRQPSSIHLPQPIIMGPISHTNKVPSVSYPTYTLVMKIMQTILLV